LVEVYNCWGLIQINSVDSRTGLDYEARQNEITRLENRAYDVFPRYLNLNSTLPWYARFERYMDEYLDKLDKTVQRGRLSD